MATTKIIPGVLDLNATGADKGLKMPSGTELNRPTDATGQIRNNTNETSEGSASAMEYYNGTEWKVISCTGLPMAYLVVAGGGSSQLANADGPAAGGAGGLRTSYGSTSGGGASAESDISLAAGTYTITVGAGGAANSYNNGSDSSISATGITTLTSLGGGASGGTSNRDGSAGGSGGGERVMVVVFHPVVLLQQVKVLMEELVGPLSVLKEEVEVEVVLRQQAKMAETVQEVMVVMDLNYQ